MLLSNSIRSRNQLHQHLIFQYQWSWIQTTQLPILRRKSIWKRYKHISLITSKYLNQFPVLKVQISASKMHVLNPIRSVVTWHYTFHKPIAIGPLCGCYPVVDCRAEERNLISLILTLFTIVLILLKADRLHLPSDPYAPTDYTVTHTLDWNPINRNRHADRHKSGQMERRHQVHYLHALLSYIVDRYVWRNYLCIYCRVPPTTGLQYMVAWRHGWRANKHAGTSNTTVWHKCVQTTVQIILLLQREHSCWTPRLNQIRGLRWVATI